jgi:hypothetical protein
MELTTVAAAVAEKGMELTTMAAAAAEEQGNTSRVYDRA